MVGARLSFALMISSAIEIKRRTVFTGSGPRGAPPLPPGCSTRAANATGDSARCPPASWARDHCPFWRPYPMAPPVRTRTFPLVVLLPLRAT
jgi:hypothetical protein